MKKLLIGFALIFIILIACIYIFIPSKIIISKIAIVDCTRSGAYRILSDKNTWQKWWPENTDDPHKALSGDSIFTYNKDTYKLTQLLLYTIEISIAHNGKTPVNSNIMILPVRLDSIAVDWQCTLDAGRNPLTRIRQYSNAVEIKNNMATILQNLQQYLGNKKNLYGIDIAETSTNDTLLIATRISLPHYPGNADIYREAAVLKDYIAKENAAVTGALMVNISPLNKSDFDMMVAFPTNKELESQGNIFYRRMIPGNFLTTTVTGGDSAVMKAQQQMHFFIDDYQKVSMAIPFQYLITDRLAEPDSSKWKTKIYFPVM